MRERERAAKLTLMLDINKNLEEVRKKSTEQLFHYERERGREREGEGERERKRKRGKEREKEREGERGRC